MNLFKAEHFFFEQFTTQKRYVWRPFRIYCLKGETEFEQQKTKYREKKKKKELDF